MVPLKPVELLDHDRAGRERIRVLVWESARQENLGEARICSRYLAGIFSGGNDEVVDHFSGALNALDGDAAAVGITKEEAAGFREHYRIGSLRCPGTQQEE
jgi:hypothetical protein